MLDQSPPPSSLPGKLSTSEADDSGFFSPEGMYQDYLFIIIVSWTRPLSPQRWMYYITSTREGCNTSSAVAVRRCVRACVRACVLVMQYIRHCGAGGSGLVHPDLEQKLCPIVAMVSS